MAACAVSNCAAGGHNRVSDLYGGFANHTTEETPAMAKVEHTSDARVLVGIDISKHRHEVLIAVPGKTRRRRLTITNSTDDFMRLIAILQEYGLHRPDRH